MRENNVGDTFCLADIKLLLQQFGFVPGRDPKNMHLNYMLRELMDPEDYRLLVPMAPWNGIRGATTLQKDIWEKMPKSRKRPNKIIRKKKRSPKKRFAIALSELNEDGNLVSETEGNVSRDT